MPFGGRLNPEWVAGFTGIRISNKHTIRQTKCRRSIYSKTNFTILRKREGAICQEEDEETNKKFNRNSD